MAAAFLASHGINLDDEMDTAFKTTLASNNAHDIQVDFTPPKPYPIRHISNVVTRGTPGDLTITEDGKLGSISSTVSSLNKFAKLVLPSLAHPHIHLDKPYLLCHKNTSHLAPESGTFSEALSLTAKAKPLYTEDALLERGAQLLAESSRAGVTHLRGFCEVDTSVDLKCINVGVKLKDAWKQCLHLQIAAFAQDSLFSTTEDSTGLEAGNPQDYIEAGNGNLELFKQALQLEGVEVLATTPYVETSNRASKRNIDWAINNAVEYNMHLDFHLDYNLDSKQEPLVWYVLEKLRAIQWKQKQKGKTVCLGHCTRLTLFSAEEWTRLAKECKDLPVYLIGLPTSDIFMQGRREAVDSASEQIVAAHNRPRATLHVLSLLKLGLHAAIGINNIGNSFTPFGTADPLLLASWAIGLYQQGTADAAKVLYECISQNAKEAMGLGSSAGTSELKGEPSDMEEGQEANLIVFGPKKQDRKFNRQRQSVEEVIWDPPQNNERMVIYQGNVVDV